MNIVKRFILLGLFVWMFLMPPTGPGLVRAALVFTVNDPSDGAVLTSPLSNGVCETAPGNGDCTLRAAITKANHYPLGGVTIQIPALSPSVVYQLGIPPAGPDDESSGDLNIIQTMTLIGGGAASTVIDGGGLDRVFHIAAGVKVTMQSLTIQSGAISGASAFGAGLQNDGTLSMPDSAVADNAGTDITESGNAIFSQGSLTLTRVAVYDNIGQVNGSVYIKNSVATISASSIYGNATSGNGGGILCDGCTLTLVDTGVDSNKAISGSGGGVYVANSGNATLNRAALTNNWANNGGGLNNNGSMVAIVNSTLSDNSANGDGGGICNCTANSATHLYSVTIANNQADADLNGSGAGGGITSYGPGGVTDFVDSIVALNFETVLSSSVYQSTPGDCLGMIASNGYNIVIAYNSSACTILGSITSADPLIGPLRLNGGLTMTQALLAGSPAIDSGNPTGCVDNTGAVLAVDQRGIPRPVGPRCDIGAFEYLPLSIFMPFVAN